MTMTPFANTPAFILPGTPFDAAFAFASNDEDDEESDSSCPYCDDPECDGDCEEDDSWEEDEEGCPYCDDPDCDGECEEDEDDWDEEWEEDWEEDEDDACPDCGNLLDECICNESDE